MTGADPNLQQFAAGTLQFARDQSGNGFDLTPRLPAPKPLGRFEMVVSGFVPDSAFKAGLVMPVDISGWWFSVERDGWVRDRT